MRSTIVKGLLLLMFCFVVQAVLAQNKSVISNVTKTISRLKHDTLRIDYLNNFVRDNFIKRNKIDGETAVALANLSEEKADKLKDNYRMYMANLNLYLVHSKLNHSIKASWYKTKSSRMSTEIGNYQLQKLERQKRELESKEKALNNSQQNLEEKELALIAKEKIISQTEQQLYLEKLEREAKETQLKTEKQLSKITQLELERKSFLAKIYSVVGVLLLFILSLVVYLYANKRKSNDLLRKQNEIIATEKKRSDDLLLNILPEPIANELKSKGFSEARSYEMATVMFTDFKDFTTISEQLTPQELVAEIDLCFKEFDLIIEKYQIEKIKTIGDAYLCAAGVPVSDPNHAYKTIRAAIDIRDFMAKLKEQRTKENKLSFDIRIGVHSGPLVAGIIGFKKFAYDIWGDTVNTAARLESSGEVGMVNVSGNTFLLIKDQFKFIPRGKISAKNKGEIDMYFAENLG